MTHKDYPTAAAKAAAEQLAENAALYVPPNHPRAFEAGIERNASPIALEFLPLPVAKIDASALGGCIFFLDNIP